MPLAPPISGRKRPFDAITHARRLRSKLPRRRRIPLLPIVRSGGFSSLPGAGEDEADSSCLHSEVSIESSLASMIPRRTRSASRQAQRASASIGAEEFRPVTRWYAKQQALLRSAKDAKKRSKAEVSFGDAASEISVSEVSGEFQGAKLLKKDGSRELVEKAPEISEVSFPDSFSDATAEKISNPARHEFAEPGISQSSADPLDSELACSERLSSGAGSLSSYSTCNDGLVLSEFESELFDKSSAEFYCSSDCSHSFPPESGSEFSQRSRHESAPPAYFSSFVQLSQQFAPSSPWTDPKASSTGLHDDSSEEFILMRFEEEEDEESYKQLRSRERRELAMHDYGREYGSKTDYGDLVLEQRLAMVNWIIEHSRATELQCETLFLAVSLMDRFLSRGYFKTERNLQLLGIACATLATRIEENQPYNSIRQKSFSVGRNVYSRSEVVAMEWLVQEVLNFQCFLPTTQNFLWFYLKAARADTEVENLARYLAVLSLLDHERLSFWPSTVAASLVILASLAADRDSSCHTVMETHVRTKNDDLPECIQSLEWLVKYAC